MLTKAEQGLLLEELASAVGGKYDLDSNHGEVGAWRNSLPVLLELLCGSGLGHVEVLLEHRLPYNPKRVDAVLCGRHPESGESSYVLIELKQWSRAEAVGNGLVRASGVGKPQLPPVAQVRRYCQHLLDFTPSLARRAEPVQAIAYLHNARHSDVDSLYNYESHGWCASTPRTSKKNWSHLRSLLDPSSHACPAAVKAADDLLAAERAPARTLLRTAADAFERRDDFVLLDEQQVAFNLVLDAVSKAEQAGDS
ncbi:hypothetical protein AB0H34_23850 [Saccharopolyspora shandongensis]|uniref:hypothetical protein n=1 Tax=Saccharopolyspora shandongensis TaxID=418495 RepID=UPI0033F0EF55